jgi:ADP-heptose:LPS heptosyltransferase
MQRFLIIQTAFIGDVILATALLEKLNEFYPTAKIDILVRKGNETLFQGHPFLHECLVWDKKNNKYGHLLGLIKELRKRTYDVVVNCQRFAASGLLTAFSGAKIKSGFDKNPFSFSFTHQSKHIIGDGRHETERNQSLISFLTDDQAAKPKLYVSESSATPVDYVCLAPASVWFTKQLPVDQWIKLANQIPENITIKLIGAKNDYALCERIIKASARKTNIENLCGSLSLLASAALMKSAKMNYVNDSAPLHLASAVNAPVTVFYCSTVPEFGFGPLSDNQQIIQIKEKLDCRPCGLHGFRTCPKGHFKCGYDIEITS